jgi:thymidylate synthase
MYILEPYNDALVQILKHGDRKKNRTGVETLAVFCIQSRYKIDQCFPLITRRLVRPKALFAELLWFLSGSTNNNRLKELGCNFWTPWVDKGFENQHHFEPGALGPLYGCQLRHFNGNYNMGIENDMGYGYGGTDQLQYVLDLLRTDPDSRRILWNLWNPKQLDEMRLAPCHYGFQFYVHGNKLSGVLTQRSCDFPVGVPFNIAFYSALIYMVAQQTGFTPWEFIHWTADSHIYLDQVEAVEEYLSRDKPGSPMLKLNKARDIDSYKVEDFELVGYNPLSHIKIPVAV